MENKKFYIFKIILFIILFLIQSYFFVLIVGRYVGGSGLIVILTSYFLVKYICDLSIVKKIFNIN